MALTIETEILELDDRAALIVRSFDDETIAYLNERGLDGNGYTWTGIVESIARSEMPTDCSKLNWSPEADELMVTSADRDVLDRLRTAVLRYASDDSMMASAIENANPEYMD